MYGLLLEIIRVQNKSYQMETIRPEDERSSSNSWFENDSIEVVQKCNDSQQSVIYFGNDKKSGV